jgi:prevent-host-death family protein
MKTATVRDLRNHFADVAKWIEDGEPVAITRNGKSFATLSPAKPEPPAKSFAKLWAARMKKFKPVGRKLSKAETEAFWSRLRD